MPICLTQAAAAANDRLPANKNQCRQTRAKPGRHSKGQPPAPSAKPARGHWPGTWSKALPQLHRRPCCGAQWHRPRQPIAEAKAREAAARRANAASHETRHLSQFAGAPIDTAAPTTRQKAGNSPNRRARAPTSLNATAQAKPCVLRIGPRQRQHLARPCNRMTPKQRLPIDL